MVATVIVRYDFGGTSGVHATQNLDITGQPANSQTVTIDTKVYTFETTLTNFDGNVLIGATAADTRDNLRDAIILGPGGGTDYAAAMTRHPTVRASDGTGDDLTATAKFGGTTPNAIATTDTADNMVWDGATLASGTDGASGTQQDITGLGPPNLRFKTADDATIDTINPIPIPGAGTNYSFWKGVYMEVSAGTFTQIDNVQFYTDGGNFGTGITANVGDELPSRTGADDEAYEVATGTIGTTGTQMDVAPEGSGHGGIDNVTDAFTFTSGATKSEGNALTISEAGNLIDAIGEGTNYFVFQMAVGTSAAPGDLPDETWTFQYDEI